MWTCFFFIVPVLILYPKIRCYMLNLPVLCHFFYVSSFSGLHCSSFSTSLCGFWTCSSGSSPAWFCTSYTLCCALSDGTTPCPWALYSAATTTSFLNFCGTASCWAKPTPTLCPPAAWGSSHSKGASVRSQTLDTEGRLAEVCRSPSDAEPLVAAERLWKHLCFDTVLFLMQCLYKTI